MDNGEPSRDAPRGGTPSRRAPTISGLNYQGATPESRALTNVFIPIVAADERVSALFRETGLDWLGQLILGCLGTSQARADADAVRLRAGLRALGVDGGAMTALRADLSEAMQLIGMPPSRQVEVSVCLLGVADAPREDKARDRRSGAG